MFSCEPGWTADKNLHPFCFRSGGTFYSVNLVQLNADLLVICFAIVPPSISGETTVPREVQVTQDSAVTLECQAVGSPLPQISWLKDGHPLLLSPRTRLLSADSVLRSVLTIQ